MLKRLFLREVGPAPSLEIELAPRMTIMTGDNGLGKSFLLDIAWWALTGTWAHYPALPRRRAMTSEGAPPKHEPSANVKGKPLISFEIKDKRGKEVSFESAFNWQRQAWSSKSSRSPSAEIVLYARADGGFSVWDPARNHSQRTPTMGVNAQRRPAAYSFSPAEVQDGLSRIDPNDPSRTEVVCNGIIRDWASWQRENGRAFQRLRRVLHRLSPSNEEPLEPGALTRISLDDARDMPTFKMPYLQEVALVHASAAVRRIVSLAYLLVWSWEEHVRASALIHQATARQITFLIDEIEAHMHPAWQRRILPSLLGVIDALTETGEVDVQIVAVTHSPLLLSSVEPIFDPARDALWALDLVDREVKLVKDVWHRRGDASSWLRSNIFELAEARSIEAEAALTDARSLMHRNVPDKVKFEEIYHALRRSMPGDDPFWVDWRAWAWRHGLLGEKKT